MYLTAVNMNKDDKNSFMYFDTCLIHGHEEYDVCVDITRLPSESILFVNARWSSPYQREKLPNLSIDCQMCVDMYLTYTYTPRSCWYYPSSELGMYVCACVCVCLREKRARKRERERESERENKRECAREKQSHESESESESESERERERE